jgi:hypothetical protein
MSNPDGRLSPVESHLNTLSILFYVWGGFGLLGGCIMAMYALFITGLLSTAATRGGPPVAVIGIFGIIFGAITLITLLQAVLTIYAGRCLANRERHTFILIMACLACLSIPFGTALGIFTIITINKPEAKALFEQAKGDPIVPV